MEASLEIPLLGPAHIADRVIAATPFIVWIIPSRPIRAGETHLEFLLVKSFPRQLDFSDAHIDQASSIPQRFGRLLDGRVALRGGANHDLVHAEAIRPGAHV